ncbi:peregrin isoform X4 [Vanessa atalanta]|uniref:peregrin isoform X4 n=1 Tax=Vanessa atalanta TaxID=42275 RepID=UPI001FCDD071|nr:peregrin isoform X4 [Vanessa atalanta]
MGLDFDVLEFCKKLRQNRPPPYQCPLEKCDKVYKSLCGLQYHLVNYDHDNPTPATPAVTNNRKKGRARAAVPTGDIALQSPPKEALTFAEAQKVVQFEIDGKISRIPIDQPLPIISLEEWEKKNSELEKPLLFVEPPAEPHVKLPEATFRLIPDYNERVCDAPARPNAYIRFIEKSAEELDGEVEYDVDEEDTAWLSIINKNRVKQSLPPVSVDTLELLMDRLEKESYFQATQNGQQTTATVDEDAVCCICMDGECQNTNVILFCDMCNLAVHQDCYGVPYIPEGQWLCRRCLQSPSRLVNCVLCPNTGGAFKQTDQGTWAHVVCALWIPEVRFANTVFLEPIDSIEMIPAARWKLQCMVCKQRGAGACIQCHRSNCYSAFHVTCAQQAGLYMKMEAAGSGRDPSQPVQVAKMAYCDTHTPAHILQESLTSHHGSRGIQDGTVNIRELCNQLKYWQRIRQDLERARLLCELVRKRERLKAELTRVCERCVLHALRPERAALHKLLRLLRLADHSDVFTEPVDPLEVPDYSTIVKHPMDLSTMGKKLDKGSYKTIDEVETDFQLMIDNCLTYNNKDTVFYKAGIKMREQCAIIFRQARRDVIEAGMVELAGAGEAGAAEARPDSAGEGAGAKPRRGGRRSSSDSERTADTRSERGASVARSERRNPSVSRDTDEENIVRASPPSKAQSKANRNWWTGRGRGRGRRGRRGRGRAGAALARDRDTPTTDSEAPLVTRKSVERTQKLATPTPEKSPPKQPDTPVLGLLGSLRKPTLLVTPSTLATPPKSFGSDASLPTLSASMGRTNLETSPRKKGRGRPRKQDKDKSVSSPDLFRGIGGGEGAVPGGASFLQYRGPPGEVGSDSDLALSRSSSSSSVWSQSCSSCTHYDDENASDHSCSFSSSDGSSYNETMDSTVEGGSGPERRRRERRAAHADASDVEPPTTPIKGRGTRSSTSKTPIKSAQPDIQLEPLQLVWAKCRGYPWYPALIIDPKMPKGFIYNGVPLPVPPQDVLNLKKNYAHEPILYLVLFFDVKRTWQWLPPNKLESLGLDKSVDQAKLVESRKPTDRKAVKKAYGDAMQFRKQVDGDK